MSASRSCRTTVAAPPLSQAAPMAIAPMAAPPRRGYRRDMKLKGTIRRNDLEGGHWVLETDKGETYQLVGSIDGCKDGMQAEIEGKVDKGGMGIGMTGPHFAVQSIKAI
jgi:hypothetical protein